MCNCVAAESRAEHRNGVSLGFKLTHDTLTGSRDELLLLLEAIVEGGDVESMPTTRMALDKQCRAWRPGACPSSRRPCVTSHARRFRFWIAVTYYRL